MLGFCVFSLHHNGSGVSPNPPTADYTAQPIVARNG